MVYLFLLLIPIMSMLARASGSGGKFGSLWSGWSGFPEMLFALPFGISTGVFLSYHTGLTPTMIVSLSAVSWTVSWLGMETGHGTFFKWNGYEDTNRDPGQTTPRMTPIDHVLIPVFNRFKWNTSTQAYSWAAMGVKGLIIGGLSLPFGPVLALLWPFSYWLSNKTTGSTELAEYVSGALAGTVLAANLLFLALG